MKLFASTSSARLFDNETVRRYTSRVSIKLNRYTGQSDKKSGEIDACVHYTWADGENVYEPQNYAVTTYFSGDDENTHLFYMNIPRRIAGMGADEWLSSVEDELIKVVQIHKEQDDAQFAMEVESYKDYQKYIEKHGSDDGYWNDDE